MTQERSVARRRFLTRVGGGLAAAVVAPFVEPAPGQARPAACVDVVCELAGIYYNETYCLYFWWYICTDVYTGKRCANRYVQI